MWGIRMGDVPRSMSIEKNFSLHPQYLSLKSHCQREVSIYLKSHVEGKRENFKKGRSEDWREARFWGRMPYVMK
ncbi:MAG: hypothetical protein QG664_769 [Patescibacteria group bacterium]|nr:hypothetical protein [Patescibacteria group bacterium]